MTMTAPGRSDVYLVDRANLAAQFVGPERDEQRVAGPFALEVEDERTAADRLAAEPLERRTNLRGGDG